MSQPIISIEVVDPAERTTSCVDCDAPGAEVEVTHAGQAARLCVPCTFSLYKRIGAALGFFLRLQGQNKD